MIRGGIVIGVAMILIGSLYASHASDTVAGRYAIIVLIYIFVVGYVASWAIVTRTICSEIQPMRTRAAATSLGQCANWVRLATCSARHLSYIEAYRSSIGQLPSPLHFSLPDRHMGRISSSEAAHYSRP